MFEKVQCSARHLEGSLEEQSGGRSQLDERPLLMLIRLRRLASAEGGGEASERGETKTAATAEQKGG